MNLYELLQPCITRFKSVRLLVGINADSDIATLNSLNEKLAKNPQKKQEIFKQMGEIFINAQKKNLQDKATYSALTQDSMDIFFSALKNRTIQMRLIKDRNIHAKFYVFSAEPLQSSTNPQSNIYDGSLIVGSSNLSKDSQTHKVHLQYHRYRAILD